MGLKAHLYPHFQVGCVCRELAYVVGCKAFAKCLQSCFGLLFIVSAALIGQARDCHTRFRRVSRDWSLRIRWSRVMDGICRDSIRQQAMG